jgi:hypothetical protein
MSQQVPRFVWLVAAVAVIGLVAAFGVAWQVASYRTAEEERDCQRTVAARADNRAMWLWIADAYGANNPQRTQVFIDELNRRLPELRCVDGDPTPVR